MRINFSAWAIRNPVPPILLFAVLVPARRSSASAAAGHEVSRTSTCPSSRCTVTQGGATPAELETQVTREVEDAVANITGVKHVQSTVTDGSSVTAIEFRLEIDTDRAVIDVKDAIDKIRAEPAAHGRRADRVAHRCRRPVDPVVSPASSPGMTLEQLSWHVDDVVKRQLLGLKGVGKVERYGGVNREIRVELDPDRLLAYGVTAAEVNRQVRATNVDLGSGRGEVGEPGAGDPRAGRRAHGGRSGGNQDQSAGRPPGAPVRSRPRHRRCERAALVRAPERRARRLVRRLPLEGRERNVGARRRRARSSTNCASSIPTSR